MKANEVVNEAWFGMGFKSPEEQEAAKKQKMLDKVRGSDKLVNAAYKQFEILLRDNKIDINNPATYPGPRMDKLIKEFAKYFFASINNANTQRAIIEKIDAVPVPTTLNGSSIKQYFRSINEIRNSAIQDAPRQGLAGVMAPDARPASPAPAEDIKDTLPDGKQYRFPHPSYSGVEIIIRKTGYYLTDLPAAYAGRVGKDKTGLYPVLRPANIQRIQSYYDKAASYPPGDPRGVKEEYIAAL